MRGLFANRSFSFQVGILIVTLLIGYFVASVMTLLLFLLSGSPLTLPMLEQPVPILLAVQFISAICMFLLPALGTAWVCSERPLDFLHIKSIRIPAGLIILVAISMFLISPAISLTGYLNSLIKLPEWMAPLEEWMRSTEEMAATLTDKLISGKGFLAIAANLIVIAVTAGITEEFFFRGALTGILRKSIKNHHLIIWIVAIVFSTIHFQFYGFIPRMLLGAYLGYLLFWTKNIWVPVFAHFLNNAVAVIGMSNSSLKENAYFAETVPAEDLTWFSMVAVVCFMIFMICIRMIRQISRNNSN